MSTPDDETNNAVWVGTCEWCGDEKAELYPMRDTDEGDQGPYYRICARCVRKEDNTAILHKLTYDLTDDTTKEG